MEQNKLFRKSALEKLASPERLDVLMRVTSPLGWLALLTIAFVLVAVVLWSIFGSMPERIDAQGILMSGGGIREIKANGEGTLAKVDIKLNDNVTNGQIIGTITQGGNADAIRAAKAKLDAADREYNMARLDDMATIEGHRATIAGIRSDIDRVNIDLAKAKDELTRQQGQLEQGYTTRQRVQAAERDVSAIESRLTQLRNSITSVDAQIRVAEQRIRQRKVNVDAARMELEATMNAVKTTTQIVANAEGRVIEVSKNLGDRVRPGETLARLEPPSAVLQAIVFVDSATGKRITSGKAAQISPTTVKREEYGFMEGTVRMVGDFPVTPDRVQNLVSNPSLAQDFIGTSPKLEMQVALVPDEKTPSGYKWSSSVGPLFKVSTGTRIAVSVVVDQKRPISQVLPILRKTFGAE
jgi:HlyD family secretion protein